MEDGLDVPLGNLKEGISGPECCSSVPCCLFNNNVGEIERVGETGGGIMYADRSDRHVLVAQSPAETPPGADSGLCTKSGAGIILHKSVGFVEAGRHRVNYVGSKMEAAGD